MTAPTFVLILILVGWAALVATVACEEHEAKRHQRPERPDPKQRLSWDKSRTVRR